MGMSDFTFRQCNSSHIGDILILQDIAFKSIPNPNWLRNNNKEMLLECLCNPHYTLGAFDKLGRLAAFSVLYIGLSSEINLGWGRYSEAELPLIGNYKLTIVDPYYRGEHLQYKMISLIMEEARQKGLIRLCTTVHPENIYSVANIISSGFKFVNCSEHYRGLLRFLFERDLTVEYVGCDVVERLFINIDNNFSDLFPQSISYTSIDSMRFISLIFAYSGYVIPNSVDALKKKFSIKNPINAQSGDIVLYYNAITDEYLPVLALYRYEWICCYHNPNTHELVQERWISLRDTLLDYRLEHCLDVSSKISTWKVN